jgi:Protein of unknown function, DUF547
MTLVHGRWFALLGIALLAGCSTLVPAPAAPTASAPQALASWARVLDRFVNDRGEVDFMALKQDRADLDRYVRFVADTPLDSAPAPAERLAHMINAYNALSMYNVIESGIPATHAGLNKLTFFVNRKLSIGGQSLSLYSFENDVIRPFTRAIGEPRVHFALNCSARSCPVLPRTPFSAAGLDAELAREAKAFFARPENFRVDPAARTVWLNEILKFYTEDFIPAYGANLIAYANRYAPQPAPLDYEVRFTPYDWSVANSRQPH